uniref:CPG4 domain-containing protein n=1 Tax=Strongyloides stercoralis TaxID=6248 RepID=A0A0K0EN41_STRER
MIKILKVLKFNLIFILFLLSYKVIGIVNKYDEMECPKSSFFGCIIKLKLNGVNFDRNIANIIYSIDSETKLLKTCKAYTNTLPCFREKISQCGSQKQRRMLNGVGKTIEFLCSPFSLSNQRILLSKGSCINYIINKPISNKCEINEPKLYSSISSCAKNCENQKGNVFCHMRTWISKQNLCTTLEIYKNCGTDAASFYSDFQSVAFEPTFPIVCEASYESIVNVKNFFKYNIKQSNNNKINNVVPFIIKNKNLLKSIVKEVVPSTNYNDHNINGISLAPINDKFINNTDKLKQTEEILEKIFPDMITKNYEKVLTTTFIPIIKKQSQFFHMNRLQTLFPNIDITTQKPYTTVTFKQENEKFLLGIPLNNEEKVNNNNIINDKVNLNEIEILAAIMSSLPLNNTLLIKKSPNNFNDIFTQLQTTTLKYNINQENSLTLLNNQNDDSQSNLSSININENIKSNEEIISSEESEDDYDSYNNYQTTTTTITTSPIPTTTTTTTIKINIPKFYLSTKPTIKNAADGKKIPWYLKGMKKHVFPNSNDGFKRFSQH